MREYCEESPPTLFNVVPSPRDDRDLNCDVLHDKSIKLPQTFNFKHKLNPARNQGIQGTCGAQVAACMKEWQERKNDVFSGTYMSPQYVYNNRINNESLGMYGRDVMRVLQKKGICEESVYPYGKIESSAEIDQGVNKSAETFKIQGYARIYKIDTLKRALIMNGPCYISFPVFNLTSRMWEQHEGEKKLGGHAMTVVGYDKTSFIIRNSWGRFWENDGYCSYPFEDWGSHYEIWCAVDDMTDQPIPSRNPFWLLYKYLTKKPKKPKALPTPEDLPVVENIEDIFKPSESGTENVEGENPNPPPPVQDPPV